MRSVGVVKRVGVVRQVGLVRSVGVVRRVDQIRRVDQLINNKCGFSWWKILLESCLYGQGPELKKGRVAPFYLNTHLR